MTTIRFNFQAKNNRAEYEALVGSLHMAMAMEVCKLIIYSDSQLIVYQVLGEYEARDEQMVQYQLLAKELLKKFE